MSERMVIAIEYEVITGEQVESRDYMQRALTGAMTQIREGADRLDPNHVKVVGVHVGVEDFVDRVLALFAKDASAPNEAPSSPVEATAGSEQRPDHTGVIRGADEAEARRMARYAKAIHDEAERLGVGRVMMLPEIVILARAVMALADAEAEDQRAAYGFLEVEVAEQIAKVAERDATIERFERWLRAERVISDSRNATIERLWAQLNEATNVPHNDPEFGFDKTAALSDPGPEALETSSGWSGPIYWTDDHDGNTTRCPGCYRATHQGTCR